LEKTTKPVARSASPATTAAICEKLEDTCSSSDALSGEYIAKFLRLAAILCDSSHISSWPPRADILPQRAGQLQASPGSGLPFRPPGPSYMRVLSPERTENRRIRN
jgi:hypothetical protein